MQCHIGLDNKEGVHLMRPEVRAQRHEAWVAGCSQGGLTMSSTTYISYVHLQYKTQLHVQLNNH